MIPFGMHPDIPEDVYYSDSALSCSMAKLLARDGGPAKLQQRLACPKVSKEFDIGHAAHELALGRGGGWEEVPGEWRSKAIKDTVEELRARGVTPLHSKDVETIHAMADALLGHAEAAELLTEPGVMPEVTLVGLDPETGLRIRSRVDVFGPASTCDYKTAVSAAPDDFVREAFKYGYDQQDAWYSDLRAQACAEDRLPFLFIVQEKTPPFLVSVVGLSERYRQIGRIRNRRAIDLYLECSATGIWPGYLPVPPLEPPVWVARRFLPADDTPTDLPDSLIWDNPWKDFH